MAGGMFLEKIGSEGLSHLSYLIGHGSRAAVVDPRRDCRVYVETAHRKGAHIEYIFETHRNEDYVIGSVALAEMTAPKYTTAVCRIFNTAVRPRKATSSNSVTYG